MTGNICLIYIQSALLSDHTLSKQESQSAYNEVVIKINVMNMSTKYSLVVYFAKMYIYLIWLRNSTSFSHLFGFVHFYLVSIVDAEHRRCGRVSGPAPEMRERWTQTRHFQLATQSGRAGWNTDLDIHKKIKPKIKHSILCPLKGLIKGTQSPPRSPLPCQHHKASSAHTKGWGRGILLPPHQPQEWTWK